MCLDVIHWKSYQLTNCCVLICFTTAWQPWTWGQSLADIWDGVYDLYWMQIMCQSLVFVVSCHSLINSIISAFFVCVCSATSLEWAVCINTKVWSANVFFLDHSTLTTVCQTVHLHSSSFLMLSIIHKHSSTMFSLCYQFAITSSHSCFPPINISAILAPNSWQNWPYDRRLRIFARRRHRECTQPVTHKVDIAISFGNGFVSLSDHWSVCFVRSGWPPPFMPTTSCHSVCLFGNSLHANCAKLVPICLRILRAHFFLPDCHDWFISRFDRTRPVA